MTLKQQLHALIERYGLVELFDRLEELANEESQVPSANLEAEWTQLAGLMEKAIRHSSRLDRLQSLEKAVCDN